MMPGAALRISRMRITRVLFVSGFSVIALGVIRAFFPIEQCYSRPRFRALPLPPLRFTPPYYLPTELQDIHDHITKLRHMVWDLHRDLNEALEVLDSISPERNLVRVRNWPWDAECGLLDRKKLDSLLTGVQTLAFFGGGFGFIILGLLLSKLSEG
jgi:hypothetical protein